MVELGKERVTVIEELSNDGSYGGGSYGRHCRGRKKLQMHLSIAEKVAVLSLNNGRSYTRK